MVTRADIQNIGWRSILQPALSYPNPVKTALRIYLIWTAHAPGYLSKSRRRVCTPLGWCENLQPHRVDYGMSSRVAVNAASRRPRKIRATDRRFSPSPAERRAGP